jgi:hypothetical protein
MSRAGPRFDGWAATYDRSQLQAVLYGPVHGCRSVLVAATKPRLRQQQRRAMRFGILGNKWLCRM